MVEQEQEMSKEALEKYKKLKQEFFETDCVQLEDEILDQMDAEWEKMSQQERDEINERRKDS